VQSRRGDRHAHERPRQNLQIFNATGTWTSPTFIVPAGGGAQFAYDRRLDAGPLVQGAPQSQVTVSLLDLTDGSTTTLVSETLVNGAYARRQLTVPAGAVKAGHAYRLRIATATTTQSVAAVLGDADTRFDNVRLTVTGSSGGGGGGTTPIVSRGVRVVSGPVSGSRISSLLLSLQRHCRGGSRSRRIADPARPLHNRRHAAEGPHHGHPGQRRHLRPGRQRRDQRRPRQRRDRRGERQRPPRRRSGKDGLAGLRGNDRLNGRSGRDRVGGGAGKDRLNGGAGKDRVSGGRGRDRIAGGSGGDRIGARDRTRDRVDGGRGRDRATVRPARGARRSKRSLRRVDRLRRVERVR
jgi:RTX calcium-binding nonapeptide repeat (4 copies)